MDELSGVSGGTRHLVGKTREEGCGRNVYNHSRELFLEAFCSQEEGEKRRRREREQVVEQETPKAERKVVFQIEPQSPTRKAVKNILL